MPKTFQKTLVVTLLALFLAPALAFAHQPRITESRLMQVLDLEISKAYYGKLGTFLLVASVVALFWGEKILRWYLRVVLR